MDSELSPLTAVRITDGLFVGNGTAAQDDEFLTLNKIRYIVNCCALEAPNLFEALHIKYLSLKWRRNKAFVGLQPGTSIFRFIDEGLDEGNCVLLHSLHGTGRAGALAVAYAMWKFHWTLAEALDLVQGLHPEMDLNNELLVQLQGLEMALIGNLSATPEKVSSLEENVTIRNTYCNANTKNSFHLSVGSKQCVNDLESVFTKIRELSVENSSRKVNSRPSQNPLYVNPRRLSFRSPSYAQMRSLSESPRGSTVQEAQKSGSRQSTLVRKASFDQMLDIKHDLPRKPPTSKSIDDSKSDFEKQNSPKVKLATASDQYTHAVKDSTRIYIEYARDTNLVSFEAHPLHAPQPERMERNSSKCLSALGYRPAHRNSSISKCSKLHVPIDPTSYSQLGTLTDNALPSSTVDREHSSQINDRFQRDPRRYVLSSSFRQVASEAEAKPRRRSGSPHPARISRAREMRSANR